MSSCFGSLSVFFLLLMGVMIAFGTRHVSGTASTLAASPTPQLCVG